jgi:hypothetical protein
MFKISIGKADYYKDKNLLSFKEVRIYDHIRFKQHT